MPSKTLLDYITTEQKKGISEAAIRMQCLGAGWPTAMIDEAFAYLKSIESGPGTAKSISLKKSSKLIPLIRLGFGLLSLKYVFSLITMMVVTLLMERAASAMLPFQILTLNGWFYPSVIGLAFLASYTCLKMFFSLPQRTKSIWKQATIVLLMLVIIEITFQYLILRYSSPLSELTNSTQNL